MTTLTPITPKFEALPQHTQAQPQQQIVRFGNEVDFMAPTPQPDKAKAIANFNDIQDLLGQYIERIRDRASSNGYSYARQLHSHGDNYKNGFQALAAATQATGIRLDYTNSEYGV